jgi:hypothetical protein
MNSKRFWLFPEMGFLTYLKNYPVVFILSLLVGSRNTLDVLARVINFDRQQGIPGFSIIFGTLGIGIPLFAGIQLLLRSDLGRRIRRGTALWIGALLLVILFTLFLTDKVYNCHMVMSHLWCLALVFALWAPLAGFVKTPRDQYIYITNLALAILGAGLITYALSFILQMLHTCIAGQVMSVLVGSGSITGLVGYVLVPWYWLSATEKSIHQAQNPGSEGPNIPMKFLMTVLVFVCLFYFGDSLLVGKWLFTMVPVSFKYVFYILTSGLVAFFSFLLFMGFEEGRWESWMGVYHKWLSWFSFPILAYAFLVFSRSGEVDLTRYLYRFHIDTAFLNEYVLLILVWLILIFFITLNGKRFGLYRPLLALMLILILTAFGPLSIRELSFRRHAANLEKIFNANEMLVGGRIQKSDVSVDAETYENIRKEFVFISQYVGVNKMQKWFIQDLNKLDIKKQSGGMGYDDRYVGQFEAEQVADRLFQMIGLEQCGSASYPTLEQYFMAERGILDVTGYHEMQELSFGGGCEVGTEDPKAPPQYTAKLTDMGRKLTLSYGKDEIAEMGFEQLYPVLSTYAKNEEKRSQIPTEALALLNQGKKAKVKIYLQSLTVMSEKGAFRVTSGQGTLLVNRK